MVIEKKQKKNWTPFSNSYAGPAYIFTMESIYYIIILYWMMLYYYILSFVCYAYWLLLYLEERNKQQYISLLRTKWKFDIKYLPSQLCINLPLDYLLLLFRSKAWYIYLSANRVSCRIGFFKIIYIPKMLLFSAWVHSKDYFVCVKEIWQKEDEW